MARAHRWVMVGMALVAASTGCAFDGSGLSAVPGGDAAPRPEPDAPAPGDAPADARPGPPDAPAAPPFCDAADPRLVACYRFESSRQAVQPHDESSHANHGTSARVTFAPSRPGAGEAIVTTATSDVRIPDSPSLDPAEQLTIELWVQPRVSPTARAGLVDNDFQYGLFLQPSGAVRCLIAGDAAEGLSIAAGRWTHVACTYDGAALRLYQDGALILSVAASGPITTNRDRGLTIGQNSPNGEPFDGAIDDVRLWSIARSPEQICAAADCPSP